jgi:hypothetical protein
MKFFQKKKGGYGEAFSAPVGPRVHVSAARDRALASRAASAGLAPVPVVSLTAEQVLAQVAAAAEVAKQAATAKRQSDAHFKALQPSEDVSSSNGGRSGSVATAAVDLDPSLGWRIPGIPVGTRAMHSVVPCPFCDQSIRCDGTVVCVCAFICFTKVHAMHAPYQRVSLLSIESCK